MLNEMQKRAAARPKSAHKGQRGAGLIEVLVAVLVLAIGLMGIAGLQSRALKNGQSAFERSQAVTLTYLMMDAMRANATAAQNGDYNIPRTCSVSSATTLVTSDRRLWLQSMKDTLGDRDTTCGEINCVANRCTVRIFWDDTRATGGDANQMVETVSVL